MVEVNPSETVPVEADKADPEVNEAPQLKAHHVPIPPHAAERQPDSSTKGMLREAIQKVMEEIAYHEREAKRHMQQADALRRDLRDSFSFLQERRGEAKPAPVPVEAQSARDADKDTKGKKAVSAASRHHAVKAKKKPAAGKGQG
jgi:hypothetical protein